MRITAKVDYGLRALCELAADPERRVKADELSRRQEIPVHFLENILRRLRDAGIVDAQRGSEGGYRLATAPEQIALADVIRALDGPLAAVQHVRPDELEFHGAAAPLVDVWIAVRAQLREVLEHVSVADVAANELPELVRRLTAAPDAWARR